MHFIFKSFLVCTGIKTAAADEEDEDPSQHPFVVWLLTNVNFVSAYDSKGSSWVQCKVDDHGEGGSQKASLELSSSGWSSF